MRRFKRISRSAPLIAAATALILLLAACGGGTASEGTTDNDTSNADAGSSTSETSDVDAGEPQDEALTKVTFVLPWTVQGESAANLVAKELGYYRDAGLDVEIMPGGPDVNAPLLLSSGAAHFTVGASAALLGARHSGQPLVAIYTQNQTDGVTLVCKDKTGIKSFADLEGKSVGVWFGTNDAKLKYALELTDVPLDSVQLLPQKFSMVEFFEDKFDCASVTLWNELHIVYDAGYDPSEIVILDDSLAFERMYMGDLAFTTEKMVNEQPEVVAGFVEASLRGMNYMLNNPEEAADIVMKHAPDLDRAKQLLQIEEANRIILAGAGADRGIGYVNKDDMAFVQDIMLSVDQIDSSVDLDALIDLSFWESAADDAREPGDVAAILERIEGNTGH